MGPLSNDDQEPWAPPGDRGLLPAPLFPDDDDDVPPPERPGADRETMRMRCALVLVLLFAAMGGMFLVQAGLRLHP